MTTGKKSFTVPILLLLITMLSVLAVAIYSKTLLDGQSAKTDRGQALASRYNYCIAFAGSLAQQAKSLSASTDAVNRLPVKTELGKAELASGECGIVLMKSLELNGQAREQATAAISEPLQKLWTKLDAIGNHEGALTADEQAVAAKVQAAGADMEKTLIAYSIPTGGDRYRQMADGVEWPAYARQAADQLKRLADEL